MSKETLGVEDQRWGMLCFVDASLGMTVAWAGVCRSLSSESGVYFELKTCKDCETNSSAVFIDLASAIILKIGSVLDFLM